MVSNILCFIGGGVCGVIMMSIFTASGYESRIEEIREKKHMDN